MMQFFYSHNIVKNVDLKDMIILDKIESNHCMNVLRYQIGDQINVVDGLGNLYNGRIKDYIKKECHIDVLDVSPKYKKRNYKVHIAIAPTKNHDRLEWFVEKAVEIGVDEISFINCKRSLRKQVRMNRINKVAITAMKQTLKAYLPKINCYKKIKDFIDQNNKKRGFICHLEDGNKKTFFDYKSMIYNEETYVLIGPEGDFDEEEIRYATSSNIKPVTLGDSRLRTETAGIVSCQLINLLNA
tara:strand:- start:413 stop:1138 length:726 start_codon:yes stop_codon:yes gene_type:complete